MGYEIISPRYQPSLAPKWTGKVYDMANVRCPDCGYAVGISGIEIHRGGSLCRLQQSWLKREEVEMKKLKLKRKKKKGKNPAPILGAVLTSQNISDLLKSQRTRARIIYRNEEILESETFDSKKEVVDSKYVVESWKETKTSKHVRVREYDPKNNTDDALSQFKEGGE